MLKKIIAIKNIGRFRNSAAPGNPHLARHTVIVGANGYGKTTICAMLRSLQTGESSHILGRKTLGAVDAPTVELLLDSGAVRFDGATWSETRRTIAIFDGVFVAENVHSGEVVDIEHKRNLYRVIVGDDGVKLAAEDDELAAASRAKTGEMSTASKAIQQHVPAGMKLEDFLGLPLTVDIDAQIAEQLRTVEAVRQSDAIRDRAALTNLTAPIFPDGFADLLSRTIEDIADDAERLVAGHVAAHGTAVGENWIASGLEQVGDNCPFCGQDIRGLRLISAFRTIFSAHYKALASEVAAMRNRISQAYNDAAIARLDTVAAQNKAAAEFWVKYCDFDAAPLALPATFAPAAGGLLVTALVLLDRKAASLLDAVLPNDDFLNAQVVYAAAAAALEITGSAIRSVNALIIEKKALIGGADVKAAEAQLARLQAIKTRHDAKVIPLCTAYRGYVADKDAIDKRKEVVRTKLDAHTKTVVKPYERRLNEHLSAFNAGFSIAQTKHAYPGGIASSSYQLVINTYAVDVGDGKTPADRPSFKNTLSAGDRTTLALAFFLVQLERDPVVAAKLVVFDDPFNSQDAFRRQQTVHEIIKVARICGQVIVLSHDATFLKQVWDKAPAADRVALTLVDHRAQGSRIIPIDIEKACLGRTATDVDDLQAYLATGAGAHLDIVRKMRVVLEFFCRTNYRECFSATDWLGEIVGRIRAGGENHPAHELYDELDQINSYTSQYHHGEVINDATPDQIDPSELTGFARRTLRIANAIQA